MCVCVCACSRSCWLYVTFILVVLYSVVLSIIACEQYKRIYIYMFECEESVCLRNTCWHKYIYARVDVCVYFMFFFSLQCSSILHFTFRLYKHTNTQIRDLKRTKPKSLLVIFIYIASVIGKSAKVNNKQKWKGRTKVQYIPVWSTCMPLHAIKLRVEKSVSHQKRRTMLSTNDFQTLLGWDLTNYQADKTDFGHTLDKVTFGYNARRKKFPESTLEAEYTLYTVYSKQYSWPQPSFKW